MSKNYPPIVQQIHNEFFTSADKMLEEANKILKNESLKDKQKGLDLERAGFKNALQVKEAKESIETEQKALNLAKIIDYYKTKYPLYKFINEENVNTICNKYKLVQGGLDLYKGFVPVKNLDQILSFSISNEDLRNETCLIIESVSFYRGCEKEKRLFKRDLEESNNKIYIEDYSSHNLNFRILKDYLKDNSNKYGDLYDEVDSVRFKIDSNYSGKTICAPISQMNMEGKVVKGNKIMSLFKPKFETVKRDPIVLQAVKHGYLIITAWGDESSDPLIVNEINN